MKARISNNTGGQEFSADTLAEIAKQTGDFVRLLIRRGRTNIKIEISEVTDVTQTAAVLGSA